jgi:SAM-dependent methyltransferase
VIDAMLDIGAVKADDYVIDLGSGDGRIVITAAKQRGARGMGVELDANLVHTARQAAQREGVRDRVSFVSDDLFFADLSRATVITMYMSEAVNQRLRPRLFKLKPGTRVVSHDFDMGEWQPDAKVTVPVPGKRYGPPRSEIYLWVVPADFSGSWVWRLPLNGGEVRYQADFTQKFQKLEGKASAASRQSAVSRVQIRGNGIRFVMGADMAGQVAWREFQGRIEGDTIVGTAVTIAGADSAGENGASLPWRATRSVRGSMDVGANAQPFGSGNFNKER